MASVAAGIRVAERHSQVVSERPPHLFRGVAHWGLFWEFGKKVGEPPTPPAWDLLNQPALSVAQDVEAFHLYGWFQTPANHDGHTGGEGGVRDANHIQFDLHGSLGGRHLIEMLSNLYKDNRTALYASCIVKAGNQNPLQTSITFFH